MVAIATQLGERLQRAPSFGDAQLPAVGQLGFVVDDLEQARRHCTSTYGVRRWYGARIRRADLYHFGEPIETDLSIAFGYAGAIQIELIDVRGGDPGIFVTPENKGAVDVHHVGLFVQDTAAWRTRFEDQGIAAAEHGSFSFAKRSKTRVAYVDVRPQIGVYAELIEHRVVGRVLGMPQWLVRLGVLTGDVRRLPQVA